MIRFKTDRTVFRCAGVLISAWLLVGAGLRATAQPSNEAAAVSGLLDEHPVAATNPVPVKIDPIKATLAAARFQSASHDYPQAEQSYLKLLADNVPEDTQKTALFEMAETVQAENDLARAQSIFTQYFQRWPNDFRTPEICLHQGQVFREMGLNNLALSKFYGVMTTALSLKDDQMAFYKRLVLQAQVEIAETHYLAGHFKDAAEFYTRLLTQSDPALDRAQIQFRLIRSLVAIDKNEESAAQAQDYLAHFADSTEAPEVRYHLAQALKGQGRNSEALQQVLVFLKEERAQTQNQPIVWTYWQQRVGNEIGNELYQEGDYVKAIEVYLALAQLDASPSWQVPVRYQVAITYEKLLQSDQALSSYRDITNIATHLGTNASPGLKAVVDMAQWRLNYLEWQNHAETFTHPPAAGKTNAPINLSLQ